MRAYKYYGTNILLGGTQLDNIKEKGYNGYHSQFRVVCKARSIAEANRIAESIGLNNHTFTSAYTSETGNEIELEMADKYGFIICTKGTLGNNYIDIKEIL